MKRSSIQNGPAWLLLASLISQVGLLAAAPVIARSMGPEARGLYYPLLALAAILTSFVILGIPQQIRRLIAQGYNVRRHILSAFIFLASFLVVASFVFPLLLFEFQLSTTEVNLFLMIWFFSAIQSILSGVLLAFEMYKALALAQFMVPGSHALLALCIIVYDYEAVPLFLSFHLAGILASVSICALISLNLLKSEKKIAKYSGLWKDSLRSFLPNIILALFSRLDLIVVAAKFGLETAGVYSIAVTATAPLIVLYEPLSSRLFRQFAESGNLTGDKKRFDVEQTLSKALSLILASGLALAVASVILIGPLFGPAFEAAVPIAIGLALSSSLAVVAVLLNDLVVARGRPSRATLSSSVGLAMFIVFVLIFDQLTVYGVVCALLGWFTTTILINLKALQVDLGKLRLSPRLAIQGLMALK